MRPTRCAHVYSSSTPVPPLAWTASHRAERAAVQLRSALNVDTVYGALDGRGRRYRHQ
jgi:hypothetical protein